MNKSTILLCIFLAAILGSGFQWNRFQALQAEVEELRNGIQQREPDPARPRPSLQKPSSAIAESSAPHYPKSRDGRPADKLRLEDLVERLTLSRDQERELPPLLTEYVNKEKKVTEQLLEAASEFISGGADYDKQARAIRRRAEFSDLPHVSGVKGRLSDSQVKSFAAFEKEQEGNMLQLLADEEFNIWSLQLSLSTERARQLAYNTFYWGWELRLESPPEEGLSALELKRVLDRDRKLTLEVFAEFVSDEDLKLMGQILQMGHTLIVEGRKAVEN